MSQSREWGNLGRGGARRRPGYTRSSEGSDWGPGRLLSCRCFCYFLPFGPGRVSPTEQRSLRKTRRDPPVNCWAPDLSELCGAQSAPVAKARGVVSAARGGPALASLPPSLALAGPLAPGAGRAP